MNASRELRYNFSKKKFLALEKITAKYVSDNHTSSFRYHK